ncbi:hypothetical protein GN316_15465 [Xylophilus sp. Kf1]|nr:hypothetical protein [Xylophilus sp. Kf1]
MPIEGSLLDYKRDLPRERSELVKTLKHIFAFHNTYGGYLIFGVDEVEKDVALVPCKKTLESFDFKVLRDMAREYLTSPIEMQARVLPLEVGDKTYEVALLHVPRRSDKNPVLVKKDARDNEGKFILKRDDACVRDGDNSIGATSFYHWRLLFGDRSVKIDGHAESFDRVRPIFNDLPDRDFICPEFIGREDYLSELYAWLIDDFACVRVLAGEGGLGKTSIAFQFATEVSTANLIDAEAVIWLTAKRLQFRALSNEYEEVVNRHFSNSAELFQSIAKNLGEIRTDWSDVELRDYPKLLRDLARHIKIFFIVDDLDSLEIDDQKRCIEVCQQLSGLGSRFLFTTRKNATASTSTAIEVEGLGDLDFERFVQSWQQRFKIKELTAKDLSKLKKTTHGSPLYTESLLRLVKGGMPIGEAVAKWEGNLGIEVRNAALKREVTQLGQEAKRVLVSVAVMGECSLAEIKLVTEYSDQTLLDATNELQSLFLLNAPAIAAQPRFSISKTTRELILSLGPELLVDYSGFQDRVRTKKAKSPGENKAIHSVGVAVNQAMALLAAGDAEGALKTVDEVHHGLKNKNKDLWYLRGRVLLKFGKPRLSEAKVAFTKAYSNGQRKPLFFGMWYDTLLDLEQYEGAVEVATFALVPSGEVDSEWLLKRASARIQSASLQIKRGDTEHSLNQLDRAADDMSTAAKSETSLLWNAQWQENFYNTHDSAWHVAKRGASDFPAWLEIFDRQVQAIERGDKRLDCYLRLDESFSELRRMSGKGSDAGRHGNIILQLARKGKDLYMGAPKDLQLYKDFRAAQTVFLAKF